jgi:hypothetical protein
MDERQLKDAKNRCKPLAVVLVLAFPDGIIDHYPLPQVLASIHKFQVNRMRLVHVLIDPVLKKTKQREVVGRVNNLPTRWSGCSDVGKRDHRNRPEFFQACSKCSSVCSTIRIF